MSNNPTLTQQLSVPCAHRTLDQTEVYNSFFVVKKTTASSVKVSATSHLLNTACVCHMAVLCMYCIPGVEVFEQQLALGRSNERVSGERATHQHEREHIQHSQTQPVSTRGNIPEVSQTKGQIQRFVQTERSRGRGALQVEALFTRVSTRLLRRVSSPQGRFVVDATKKTSSTTAKNVVWHVK